MNEDPRTPLVRRKSDSKARVRRSSGAKRSSTADAPKQKSPSQATENSGRRSSTRRQGSDRELSRRGKSRKSVPKKDDLISKSTHNPSRPKSRPALSRPKSVRSLATRETQQAVSKKKDNLVSQSTHNPMRPKTRPALHRPKSVRGLATHEASSGVDKSLRRKERVRKSASSTQKATASWNDEGDKPNSRATSYSRSNSSPVSPQDKCHQPNSQEMHPPTLEAIESGNDQSDSEIDERSPSARIPLISPATQEIPQIRQSRPGMVLLASSGFNVEDEQTNDDRSESSDDESSASFNVESASSSSSSNSFAYIDVDSTMKSFNMSMKSTSSSVSGHNTMPANVGHATAQKDIKAASSTTSKIFLGLQYLGSSHINEVSESEASTLEGSEHQSEVSDSEFDHFGVPQEQKRQDALPPINNNSDEQVAFSGSNNASGNNANIFDSNITISNNNNQVLSRSEGVPTARNLLWKHSEKNLSNCEANDRSERRSASSLLKKAKSLRKLSEGSNTASRVDRMLQYAESFRNLSNKAAEVKASSRQEAMKLSREVY